MCVPAIISGYLGVSIDCKSWRRDRKNLPDNLCFLTHLLFATRFRQGGSAGLTKINAEIPAYRLDAREGKYAVISARVFAEI